MSVIHIKSKFDAEFRRFSIPINSRNMAMSFLEFRKYVEDIHALHNIPFTLCYTSVAGDLLPITNDDSAHPCLRLLIQRKGESWEEKYGYGTDSSERKRKGLSLLMPANKPTRRNYNISNPEDFRQVLIFNICSFKVSAIIDVHAVPETHRRVRLCKHGSERPLGFYICRSSTIRVTSQGAVKGDGIFISRLVDGGLAESTGLLGIGDEVIEVYGKSIDQVTDMMVANAQNLIITIKPANQNNTLHNGKNGNELTNNNYTRGGSLTEGRHSTASSGFSTTNRTNAINNSHNQLSYDSDDDDDEDEIVDHTISTTYRVP